MGKPVDFQKAASEAAADSDHWRRLYFEMQDERDKYIRMHDEMASAHASSFGELHNISLLTRLGGEVDDYAEVTKSVREIVDERDALRAQIERMQRVVDAAFWFAGYVPLQRGLKVQQKRLSDALAALDALTPAGGGDAGARQ